MPTSILLTDRRGQLMAANEAARDLLDLPTCLHGVTCQQALGALGLNGLSPCRLCSHEPLGATEQREHGNLHASGQSVELICTGMGEQRVITLLPLDSPPDGPSLTPREKEVLVLVARGLTTARIADRLGLGYPTVRTHMEHIREKLGVRTRAQAVARALALHMIE